MINEILSHPTTNGILGALIGSYLGYQGTVFVMREQLKAAQASEAERRKYEKEKQGRLMLDSIIVELEENLEIANDHYQENARMLLKVGSWDRVKHEIDYLDDAPRKQVLAMYAAIAIYNNLANLYNAHLVSKGGTDWLGNPLGRSISQISGNLPELIKLLKQCYHAGSAARS